MYVVTVKHNRLGSVDQREFHYGQWAEIGFWLDHYGYNTKDYTLDVRFT